MKEAEKRVGQLVLKASEVREAAREAQRMKREKEQREQRRERQEPYLQRPFTDSKREERYKEKEQRQEEQERVERDERLKREANAAEEARKAEVARLQKEERQRLQQEEDERIRRQGEDAERERVRQDQQARIDRGDDWREVEEGKEQEPPVPGDDDDNEDDEDDQNKQSHFVVVTVDEVKEEDVDKERKKQEEKKRESRKTPEQRKAEAEEAAKKEETALKQRSARKKVIDRYKARVKAKEVARQKKDDEQTAETRQRRKDAAVAGGYLDQPRGDGQPSTSQEDTPRKRKRGVLDEVALAEGLAQLKKRKAVKASIKEKGQVDDAFLDPSYQPQMEEEEEEEEDDLGEVPLRTVKEGAGEGETTHEHCSNPDEAEDHRIRIYASVYGLQEMVKSGDAVGEAYKDFLKVIVDSLLEIKLYMNIEKADVDAVYGLVPDQECEIWRQVMVGGEEISQMRAESIKEQIMKPVVERENKVKVTIDWTVLEDGMNEDETRNLRSVCGEMFKDLRESHRFAARVADKLVTMSEILKSDKAYGHILEVTARPLMAIYTPKLDILQEHRVERTKQVAEKLEKKLHEAPIEEVMAEVSVPTPSEEWKPGMKNREEMANAYLTAIATFLIRETMGDEAKITIKEAATRCHVGSSTLTKLISGRKFWGGEQARARKRAGKAKAVMKAVAIPEAIPPEEQDDD